MGSESLNKNLQSRLKELNRREGLDIGSDELDEFYIPVARWILEIKGRFDRPVLIGINGAQGSGKSTLSLLLREILQTLFETRTAIFSIDDLYRTRDDRLTLAEILHPLLKTRGVPGTHDLGLGHQLIGALMGLKSGEELPLPSFDKARDDRRREEDWPRQKGPVDVILFEGWCVGATPQQEAELLVPINTLETEEDVDGAWRRFVNEQLEGPYAELFERLDALMMLKVPSFEKVYEWRGLQERKLAEHVDREETGGPRVMNERDLHRFIMHYERLTRHMLKEMPARADLLLVVGEDHRICAMQRREEKA